MAGEASAAVTGAATATSTCAKGAGEGGRERVLEEELLEQVGLVASAIAGAKRVDDVICALHSLAVRLFAVNSKLLSGVLDETYKSKVIDTFVPEDSERDHWKRSFYQGAAFPTLSRILIYSVTSDWLACFPLTARKLVFDSFFINAPPLEIMQALVPSLLSKEPNKNSDKNAVSSNAERLLGLCLLENGVYTMALGFGNMDEYVHKPPMPKDYSVVHTAAQLLSSIPDKVMPKRSNPLSAHFFFKQVTVQLIAAAEERATKLFTRVNPSPTATDDGTFVFVTDAFARICRRGSADILLAASVPRILDLVRYHTSNAESSISVEMQSDSKSFFWSNLMEYLKDPFVLEKLTEDLLRILASEDVSDMEAYWTLWLLYHRTCTQKTMLRSLFRDKFLLWKVFPLSCLKWILQFSVLDCPPSSDPENGILQNADQLAETLQLLLNVWSKREFIQNSPMDQQAYITAAVGLCLETIQKEKLEATHNALNSILQGISCRLESPLDLVRRMASSVALVFSRVVDPNNPLYLDDSCKGGIDWGLGLISSKKRVLTSSCRESEASARVEHGETTAVPSGSASSSNLKHIELDKDTKLSKLQIIDPDEVIDPAHLYEECHDAYDENASETSETSSESSLQPYDMSDDDTDLRKNVSQLVDLVAALRKSDEPDGVEEAIGVAEKLIRASPDELQHTAADLTRTLVQIRCSELAVHGEEESAEEKRHNALVSLLVMCPFESVDMIHKLLYSPNLDVSQRILIIDAMTDAALELARSKTLTTSVPRKSLISSFSDQAWFLPGSKGPEGSGPWTEVSEPDFPLRWSHSYERTVPSRSGQVRLGKTRRWGLGLAYAQDDNLEWSKNRFPLYAAAFMLPAMQGFDKRRHGVDLLGRDFIVLGKLIHMLGVCMKCTALHPEASALAPAFLDMLSSRNVCSHAEAYVRRSVLFASSCILVALHPSFIATALTEGNEGISKGLEWIRTWALHIAETDPDTECNSMAMGCLQLHSDMALQTSRALESGQCFNERSGILSATTSKEIILPIARKVEY